MEKYKELWEVVHGTVRFLGWFKQSELRPLVSNAEVSYYLGPLPSKVGLGGGY